MTMITPSYLGETIEYSSLHACRSTLEDPTFAKAVEPGALATRGEIIVAKDEIGVLGTAVFVRPDSPFRQAAHVDEAEVHLVAVSLRARRSGVAKALMGAFERKALRAGFRKAVLSTQPSMVAAQRLYEGLGYSRNHGRDYRREDGREFLVYEKALG